MYTCTNNEICKLNEYTSHNILIGCKSSTQKNIKYHLPSNNNNLIAYHEKKQATHTFK